MDDLSELESLLLAEACQGKLDSSGQFTLDEKRALLKLKGFSLPRATLWVVKVVQAAVVAKCASLRIRQTRTDTEFFFESPHCPWTFEIIEKLFFEFQPDESRDLTHLKQALWTVAGGDARPFQWHQPGRSESLIWTGQGFLRLATPPEPILRLTVSHRPLRQNLPWDNQPAAKARQEARLDLLTRAHMCPIPLWLDDQRIDAVQANPNHGYGPTSYPLAIQWGHADSPGVPVPHGTFGGYQPAGNSPLNALLQTPDPCDLCPVICMLTAHLEMAVFVGPQGRHTAPVPSPIAAPSALLWILDGVVIQADPIPALTETPISCAVIASAEGLTTDLSGFRLAQSTEQQNRRKILLKAVNPLVQAYKLNFAPGAASAKQRSQRIGSKLMIGAGLTLFLTPLVHPLLALFLGFAAVPVAGIGYVMRNYSTGEEGRTGEPRLQEGLDKIKREWALLSESALPADSLTDPPRTGQ